MHDLLFDLPRCILTDHSRRRLAQRNLSEDVLFEAEAFGRRGRYEAGKAELWRIDRRIVSALQRTRPSIRAALGVIVVTSPEGVCVTAYRNR